MNLIFSAKDALDEPAKWQITIGTVNGRTMVTPLIEQEPFLMALIDKLGNTEFVNAEQQLLDAEQMAEQQWEESIFPIAIGELIINEVDGGYVFTTLEGTPFPIDRLLQIFATIPGMEEMK